MKKVLIVFFLIGLVAPVFGQVEVNEVAVETADSLTTLPDYNEDVVLPDVPWGFDFHKYFASIWVYIATILGITQVLKKLLRWADNKAFWLSVAIAALMAGAGFYFKLGVLAVAPWYGAVAWFVAFVLGSKLGYKLMVEIVARLGFVKKK